MPTPTRLLVRSLGLTLALCLATPSFEAHGGTYRPPGGSGGPTPPPSKVPLPGPGSPTAPSSPGGARPRSPRMPPGAPGSGGALSFDRTHWSFWWEFNGEVYLGLKEHLYRAAPTSPESQDGPTTTGDEVASGAALRPTPAQVRGEVLPPLLAALDGERQPDILSSTLVALGRIGDDLDPDARRLIAERVRGFLDHGTREVAEAAVVALGILGDASEAPLLASLLADGAVGREAVGGRAVQTRMRAFAAYALGLIGHGEEREDVRRFAAHALVAELEGDEGSVPDVHAACVLALGLLPPSAPGRVAPEVTPRGRARVEPDRPTASLAGHVHFLRGVLDDAGRHDLVRAQVPISLARSLRGTPVRGVEETPVHDVLLDRVAKDLLARLAPMRREPREVVQSCVLALGFVGDDDADPGDVAIRAALADVDDDHADPGARGFARIALARCGARAGAGPEAGSGAEEVRRALLRELARGSSALRPWTALALGVLERGRLDRGVSPSADVGRALRATLEDPPSPDAFAAAALSTGLLRDLEAEGLLLARATRGGDDRVRGAAAVALGLAGAQGARESIRQLVRTSIYRPALLRDAAAALGLLGDKGAADDLVGLLESARGLASQAAVSRALGRIGDARSIAPLVELLENERVTDQARAFAAVALGIVGDTDPLPWNAPLAAGGNYLAAPGTLYDQTGLGLLNIL